MLLNPARTKRAPRTPRSPRHIMSVAVPDLLFNWILDKCEETGKTMTQVVLDAVRETKKKDDDEKRQNQ